MPPFLPPCLLQQAAPKGRSRSADLCVGLLAEGRPQAAVGLSGAGPDAERPRVRVPLPRPAGLPCRCSALEAACGGPWPWGTGPSGVASRAVSSQAVLRGGVCLEAQLSSGPSARERARCCSTGLSLLIYAFLTHFHKNGRRQHVLLLGPQLIPHSILLNAAIKILLFLLSWQIITSDFPYVVY